MSDSPPPGKLDTLSKMDALLKKHRGGGEGGREEIIPSPPVSAQATPPGAWLPVLTQVIERGTPPAVSAPAETPIVNSPAQLEAPAAETPPAAVSDTLAEQLMSELAPRLSEVMEKKVAAELRKNIDQTVSSLLSQLDVNVREIVREAIAEKLRKPRDPSA